jgi:hypothetical protein
MTEILERLAAANIQLLPLTELPKHFVFGRDGFIALVERRGDGFGPIGSAGILLEQGYAALVHRGGKAYFVCKGFEQPAEAEQVERLRLFSSDLRVALGQT